MINGSILVSRLVASLYARDAADRMSTYRLLLGFAVVSSGVVLLQLFTLRYCSQLMRRGGANAAAPQASASSAVRVVVVVTS